MTTLASTMIGTVSGEGSCVRPVTDVGDGVADLGVLGIDESRDGTGPAPPTRSA